MALVVSLLAGFASPARSQGRGALGAAVLAGGVDGLQRALGDRLPFDRALVVSEIARRFYNTPVDADETEDPSFARARRWLEAVARLAAAHEALDPHHQGFRRSDVGGAGHAEARTRWADALGFELQDGGRLGPAGDERAATRAALASGGLDPTSIAERFEAGEPIRPPPAQTIPLPLDAAFWQTVVFDRRVALDALGAAILMDRRAALLHTALVSLDADTRAALAAEPGVVQQIDGRAAGAFAIAAPFLRLVDGRWQLPGGTRAEPAWEALAGAPPADRMRFLLALLRHDSGRLAYFVEVLASLPRPHVDAALSLTSDDPATRIDAARRLHDAVRGVSPSWSPGGRPFLRPLIDPVLLLRQLRVVADGGIELPGDRTFWERVFDGGDTPTAATRARAVSRPLSFDWLIERTSVGTTTERRTRYEQLLYAARHFPATTPREEPMALAVLRGYARFPQLLRELERLGRIDRDILAAAVQAAHALDAIRDEGRRLVALAQWQGALGILGRIDRAGTMTSESRDAALRAWAAVRPDAEGRLRGAIVRWALEHGAQTNAATGPQPLGSALFARLLPWTSAERHVAWEGTLYRIDHAAAERFRLARVRGPDPPAFFEAAADSLALAQALDARDARVAASRDVDAALDGIAHAALLPERGSDRDRATDAAIQALDRARQRGPARRAEHVFDLADSLGALALTEAVYAVALGSGEELPLRSRDAARRHTFGKTSGFDGPRDRAWMPPQVVAETRTAWHVSGSLLGLDVGLAHLSLRRLSRRPPAGRPQLNDGDRHLLIESVVLVERRALTPGAHAALISAMARGRRALTAVGQADDLVALTHRLPLSALRRHLAPWVLEHDRTSLATYFSVSEIVALGLETDQAANTLSGWGNSCEPLTGRRAAGGLPDAAWELYGGRLSSGLLASVVPDVQLRVAELLAGLDMPADVLPDVLSSAVLEFVNTVPSRHPDDWRALVLTAAAIGPTAVERFLALLTTDGVLQAAPRTTSER